jgi:hypothetical protein
MGQYQVDPEDDFFNQPKDEAVDDKKKSKKYSVDEADSYNNGSVGETSTVKYSPNQEKISKLETLLQSAGQTMGSDELLGLVSSQVVDPAQRILSHTGLVDKAPSQYMEEKPSTVMEDVGNYLSKTLQMGTNPIGYLYANDQVNKLAKKLGKDDLNLPNIQSDPVYKGMSSGIREDARKAISANPATALVGAGIGTALTIPLTPAKLLAPLKVAEDATRLVKMGKGAVNAMPTAAIQGALATEAETLPEQALDVGMITGLGAGIGGVAQVAASPLASAAKKGVSYLEKSAPTVFKAYELGRQGINIFDELAQKDFRQTVSEQLDTLKTFISEKRKRMIGATDATKKEVEQQIAAAERRAALLKETYDRDVFNAQATHSEEISIIDGQIQKAEEALEKANTEAKKSFETTQSEDLKKINDDIRLYSREAQKEVADAHVKIGQQYDQIDNSLNKSQISYKIHEDKQNLVEALDNSGGLGDDLDRIEKIKRALFKLPKELDNAAFRIYREKIRNTANDPSLPYNVRKALRDHIRAINLNRLNTVQKYEAEYLKKFADKKVPMQKDLVGISSRMQETDRIYSTLMELDDFISRESIDYAQPLTIETIAKAKKAAESNDPKAREELVRYMDLLKQLGDNAEQKLGKPVIDLADAQLAAENRTFTATPKEKTTVNLEGETIPYTEASRRSNNLKQISPDDIKEKIEVPPTAEQIQTNDTNLQADLAKLARLEERLKTPHTATEEYGTVLKVAQEDLPDVMNPQQQSFIDEGAPIAPDEQPITFTQPSQDELTSRLIAERKGILEKGNRPTESTTEPYIERLLREYEKLNPASKIREKLIESNKISEMFSEMDQGLENRTIHGLYTSPKTYAGGANLTGRAVRQIRRPVDRAIELINKIDPNILTRDTVAKTATLNTLLQNKTFKEAMQRDGITEEDLKQAFNNKFVGPPEE